MGKNDPVANCLFGAQYMLTQVEALQAEIQGALVGDDIEHVHQMRVASRRMRNGLNLFADCLSKKKAAAWRDQIRLITKALGNARDLDIQIDLVNRCIDVELEERLKAGYNRLLLRLKQERTKAQVKVQQTLTDLQQGGILDRMNRQLMAMTESAGQVYLYTPSLYQQAFEAISSSLDGFLDYESYIYDPLNIKELHAMRIEGKHLRYTLEIFAPIYGNALELHIRAMKGVQDLLGEIHDNDVWIAWLPKFMDKEQARVEAYFGNQGPFKRLVPGLHHFMEDRQQVRADEYRTFLTTWEALQYEQAWTALRDIISAPMNIEAALLRLPQEAGEVPANEEKPVDVETELTDLVFDDLRAHENLTDQEDRTDRVENDDR
jgi:CHAD domain-containing protein